ncbi:hypothetical protein PR202_gb16193 [Eleusine coracana subsp. coracana]|uniref:Aminotransferase class V domain-containing protein n=1 Tax=Eleusine coracana subsp. coracana TaxID=191504 RepID=A0AAV5F1B9_ELECO|nr:hypothetical protein PR202_gb16193 [Eleusine coracana subsp. coracana]
MHGCMTMCSTPYVEIDMRSGAMDGYDAVFLSPHKFRGGPGTRVISLCEPRPLPPRRRAALHTAARRRRPPRLRSAGFSEAGTDTVYDDDIDEARTRDCRATRARRRSAEGASVAGVLGEGSTWAATTGRWRRTARAQARSTPPPWRGCWPTQTSRCSRNTAAARPPLPISVRPSTPGAPAAAKASPRRVRGQAPQRPVGASRLEARCALRGAVRTRAARRASGQDLIRFATLC